MLQTAVCWLLLLLLATKNQTTTGWVCGSSRTPTDTQPVVVEKETDMGRGIADRFGDESDAFSDTFALAGSKRVRPKIDPELLAIWGSMKQTIKDGPDAWSASRQVVVSPLPDPTEDNDNLDCADQVRATRSIAEELARLNNHAKLGFGGIIAALLDNSGWLARLYALIAERSPHRDWSKAAVADLQQQIKDGFTLLAMRKAQEIEAAFNVRVKELDLPDVGPTGSKFDHATDLDFQETIWKLTSETLKISDAEGV